MFALAMFYCIEFSNTKYYISSGCVSVVCNSKYCMIHYSKADIGLGARDKLEEVVNLFQNQTQGNGKCSDITLMLF